MKKCQNEKGIALLMAIFMLVIFSILGLAIITMANQGQKQRDLSNEQIEGKMLADTGLLYFRQYLDANLKSKSLNDNDGITGVINDIASENSYKTTKLQDGSNGSFKIMYENLNMIPYQDDSNGPSQPYIRKLKVSVVGVPGYTSHFKSVKLTAIVYINTISAPFHYAISTPSELHLFGGSNIIGNVITNKLYVSTQHFQSQYVESQDKDVYSIDPPTDPADIPYVNLPYVEGKVFLHGDPLNLYKVESLQVDDDQQPKPVSASLSTVPTDRLSLQSLFTRNPNGDVSAPIDAPYLPGSEPPLVESQSESVNQKLTFTGSSLDLNHYIRSLFDGVKYKNPDKTLDNNTLPLWMGAGSGADLTGFDPNGFVPDPQSSDSVIYTNQQNLLSVRLTGNTFPSTTKRLLIGPNPDPEITDADSGNTYYDSMKASVEMGTNKSFKGISDEDQGGSEDPFTFTGSIFIKGDLDIVGDINVNGTIYVDGNVNIRENNGSSETSNNPKPNLVILSTGKITISDRNSNLDPKEAHPLSAFLYSESQPIEIYSHTSVNWFYGGLATGTGNIELDTKREDQNSTKTPFASHMTIQFNRGIFEQPTPGLPSEPNIVNDNKYYFDTYDIIYKLDDNK